MPWIKGIQVLADHLASKEPLNANTDTQRLVTTNILPWVKGFHGQQAKFLKIIFKVTVCHVCTVHAA